MFISASFGENRSEIYHSTPMSEMTENAVILNFPLVEQDYPECYYRNTFPMARDKHSCWLTFLPAIILKFALLITYGKARVCFVLL